MHTCRVCSELRCPTNTAAPRDPSAAGVETQVQYTGAPALAAKISGPFSHPKINYCNRHRGCYDWQAAASFSPPPSVMIHFGLYLYFGSVTRGAGLCLCRESDVRSERQRGLRGVYFIFLPPHLV